MRLGGGVEGKGREEGRVEDSIEERLEWCVVVWREVGWSITVKS